MSERRPSPGRPRDTELDEASLEAARELRGDVGYEALSLAAIATRAGTTRPAIYRRYADKDEIAVAAIASLSEATAPKPSGDHRRDLLAELQSFRSGIVAANGLPLAASILTDATSPSVKAAYRKRVVAPRRARLAAILQAAHRADEITAGPADQRVAITMCTGSWYGFAIAGTPPPTDWAARTARLVWAAVGGAS